MPVTRDLSESIFAAWRTSNQVAVFLVSRLPSALWASPIPGTPRKTIRMLAGHLHNSRCMWLKTLGRPHGIPVPAAVDRRSVSRRQLVAALKKSSRGIEALLRLGVRSGGSVPASPVYTWRNLPLDVGHLLTYFVAHEAHHRGQIVLAARQIEHNGATRRVQARGCSPGAGGPRRSGLDSLLPPSRILLDVSGPSS